MSRGPRARLLGRSELSPQHKSSIETTGLFEIHFSRPRGGTTMTSLDGNRTLAFMLPSGEIGGLLVQDYALGADERTIPFEFGDVVLANDGESVTITLHPRAVDER